MDIKSNLENNVLTLFFEGHIDSSNAPEAEKKINEFVDANPNAQLVIDAENLQYISSVGLRIILRLKKAHKELKIVNVSNEVYDVFDMTGFTEMMDISKAYRKLSVDGCEMIGQGSNGVVYRLDADTIIKVYRNPDSLPDIHRERELARKALVLGIPTAIPYDVVKVGNTYGSVFELLNATSFAKIVEKQPERFDETVKEFVKLAKQIHSTEVDVNDMPDMKQVAVNWAKYLKGHIPDDQFEKLVSLMEAVPERHTMLHGDYHFKNVMIQDGEVLLIDMDTLCYGHPVFEFASIFNANVGFGEIDPSVTMHFMGLPVEKTVEIWNKTLEYYFETTDKAVLDSISNKAQIIGYTRLLRRTLRREPDNARFIEHCKNKLAALLPLVDTLEF